MYWRVAVFSFKFPAVNRDGGPLFAISRTEETVFGVPPRRCTWARINGTTGIGWVRGVGKGRVVGSVVDVLTNVLSEYVCFSPVGSVVVDRPIIDPCTLLCRSSLADIAYVEIACELL